MTTCAIVPAAGRGSRMGADKALLDLGGETAVERIAAQCRQAFVDHLVIVRARGADPLPQALPADFVILVEVEPEGEMIDSLRAGLAACPAETDRIVVFPVDHALVTADTVCAVHESLGRPGVSIALPLHRDRPGHPIALTPSVAAEMRDPATASLREVIRRDPGRVCALPTANPWVRADLDRPADLRAARAALQSNGMPAAAQMHLHRSRRAFSAEPLAEGQLERLVDAARRASTSAFVQAYSVVAVREPARKAECARLCGDQDHIRQAPVFLAVCADMHKVAHCCRECGTEAQTDGTEAFVQATVDAALLGQNLQLAAESEDLGSCMIGGARNHPVELAQLLRLPARVYVVFGMVLGHATDDPLHRDRMPLPAVLHREEYSDRDLARNLEQADELVRDWARRFNVTGPARPIDESKGWGDRVAGLWGEGGRYVVARPLLRQHLRRLGFGVE